MKLGIKNTLAVLDALKLLAVDAVAIAHNGVGLGSLSKLMTIAKQAKILAISAKDALPELADLDGDEAQQLAEASFEAVKSVLLAVNNV